MFHFLGAHGISALHLSNSSSDSGCGIQLLKNWNSSSLLPGLGCGSLATGHVLATGIHVLADSANNGSVHVNFVE